MKKYKKVQDFIKIILLLAMAVIVQATSLYAEDENNVSLYQLTLSLSEYSVLNSAMVSGLNNYGGSIDFHLTMKKEKNAIYWILTIQNKKHLNVLKKWIAERSIEIISSVSDFSQLDQTSQIALGAIKALTAKIDGALNKQKQIKKSQ